MNFWQIFLGSMEMDYINGYSVPYKKVLGFNVDYNLSFEYPTRYPSGGVAGDRLMSFMEGSIKALGNNGYNVYSAYNVYMIENTVNGEEETLLWTGSNANNLPSKNFTKFRVEFSFVFKVLCMYYQYAYVLANQKKDLTETLKYRWSITS